LSVLFISCDWLVLLVKILLKNDISSDVNFVIHKIDKQGCWIYFGKTNFEFF
jgi:hypothetical protein